TDIPGGISVDMYISPDGQWVYYLQDQQGTETGHFVRMPFEGGDPQDITPQLPPYSPFGFMISRSGNRIVLTAVHDNVYHVYCLDIDKDGKPGALREIHAGPQHMEGVCISHDGDVVVVRSTECTGNLQFSLLAFNGSTGKQISELRDGSESSLDIMLPSPLPGDPRLLATTTRTGLESLLIWNPRTGERTDLSFENVTGAMRTYDWSPDGRRILFRTFNAAVQQLYIHDLTTGETTALRSPAGMHLSPCFSPDGTEIYSRWESATRRSSLIALSARTGEMLRTLIAAGEMPPGHELKSVTFPSSDGQVIQAWLGIPDGTGPFPTVIDIHGGPETVRGNNFSPDTQAWLDHGFAYLAVNYRGSTTFGREFEQKIWSQPGYWEIEDLVAARDWLVEQNIAKANAVFLTGWSYGGYLTLLGLGKRPEFWAGGMAGIAATDWAMSYEDAAENIRGWLVSLFGGTPEEKPEQYRVSSPITYVENVKAPVLIIQGRNDTIAPPRPVEVYESRMKALGKEIEVFWYDTGHGGSFTSMDEAIRHQELMLRFAFRVLGHV
ncbi:MAG: prolyl oligopeptidase family serine peptidase, partial [Anaerolineales bacterium]